MLKDEAQYMCVNLNFTCTSVYKNAKPEYLKEQTRNIAIKILQYILMNFDDVVPLKT